MARPVRLEFRGALYHVTARGDRRESIYEDDTDREHFLAVFADVIERFNWRCHAYCLMGNHYHLLIATPDGNLSKGMRQLNGVFTQWSNRRHRRTGHLFQGRYKAILIDADRYLLELTRYVVLNPVRARLVKSADRWPWSSYCATTGAADAPAWLHVDGLLAQFGTRRGRAVSAYERFVHEGLGVNQWGRRWLSAINGKRCPSRPSARPATRRSIQRTLDHLPESFITQRPLLGHGLPNSEQLIVRDPCREPAPIGVLSLAPVNSHRKIKCM